MFDHYDDLAGALERQLLVRQDPPSHADARIVLKAAKIEPLEICVVLPDAIVYRNQGGQVTTAWTHVSEKGKCRVLGIERGMPAWPSAYISEQAA